MSGSLQIKGNKYYVVVRMLDENGLKRTKWIPTGIAVKGGSKRDANAAMRRILTDLERNQLIYTPEMLFTAWIDKWMEQKRNEIRLNSWEGYKIYLEKHIRPFFDAKNVTLSKLTPQHLQEYINKKIKEGLSVSTIKKHNAVLRGALTEAYKKGLLPFNPSDRVTIPRLSSKDKFKGKAYTAAEAKSLLEAAEHDVMQPAIILALYHGLRKSEALGLRWSDIDFTMGTLSVKNTVTRMQTKIEHEETKSNASRRTLFLTDYTQTYLTALKLEQEERRRVMGAAYQDSDHICVWPDGRPLTPDYVSQHFKRFLIRHGLPVIRFHDLRHTAGSLLLSQKMTIKQIQEFLGHEQSSTTLDIYSHLDPQAHRETAQVMGQLLDRSAG